MAVKQETIDKYVGKVFPSTYDGDMEVLEVLEVGKCVVKFLESGNTKEAHLSSVSKSEVRDTGARPTYKVGIMDVKGYIKRGEPKPKDYNVWSGVMQRCYNKKMWNIRPTYTNVEVSEDFKYFSKFKEWYNRQIGSDNEGWHLDKDLLSKGGTKEYCAENCVLVPPEINSIILSGKAYRGKYPQGVYLDKSSKTERYRARLSKQGKYMCIGSYSTPEEAFQAYKQAKEAYIKEVAKKWKDKIDRRAYEALMSWEININD